MLPQRLRRNPCSRTLVWIITILVLSSGAGATPLPLADYTFNVLGTNTIAKGINDLEQVVGLMTYPYYPIIYSNGSSVPFESPASNTARPTSINNAGQVIGTLQSGGSGFLDTNGTYTLLDGLSNLYQPYNINNFGQIIGISNNINYEYSNGVYTALPVLVNKIAFGINDYGSIVGCDNNVRSDIQCDVGSSFLYKNGIIYEQAAPGAGQTVLVGINNAGQEVGYYSTTNSSTVQGLIFDHGTYSQLDYPGATSTTLLDINDLGQVAGYYLDAAGIFHGFVATPNTVSVPEPPSIAIFGFMIAVAPWAWIARRGDAARRTPRANDHIGMEDDPS